MKNFRFHLATVILPFLIIFIACKKDGQVVVVQGPEIISMYPTMGPRGTIVTLKGQAFGNDVNKVSVYVNGKLGNVTAVTKDSIQFVVPSNAGSGPVTISVDGEGASGPDFDFIYTVTVTTFSGIATQPGLSNGPAITAMFHTPRGLAIDNLNNIYVADELNHCIRRISTSGVVTTFAGSGVQGHNDGNAAVAKFNHPYDIDFDPINQNFYVADRDNHCIRKISMLGDVITIAGIPGTQGYVDAPGQSARFISPTGVAVTGELAKIYVADAGNHCIRKIDNLSIVTTFAGSVNTGNIDGTGSAARFSSPFDIAWDTAGYLVVTDIANHNIRRISENGHVITIGGTGVPGFANGMPTTSMFNTPNGIISHYNERFVCDAMNHMVRKIEIDKSSHFTGYGTPGAVNGNTWGTQPTFNQPSGIVRDSHGNIFISEAGNHDIRKLTIE